MWAWIVGGLVAWGLAALVVAVVLGRGIRLADQRAWGTGAPAEPRPRRRRVPLPPIGVALAAVAVVLMTTGYATRLSGARGPLARFLDMDAPFSLPRLYVAALFAVAALAAAAGAARNPGRRTWWAAVGVVTAAIAVVKAGSTLHADAMQALAAAVGSSAAVVVSVLLAAAVLLVLGVLSRAERRDRRRVLLALGAYAAASVGLSALSSAAGSWAATATFLEESGEALAGVSVLVAVLVGVAPRLVLPAAWRLRRQDDALGLEVPDLAPGAEGHARG
ncbi:hypothetical protein [Geodermatophilus marinus]|uniref:hypothetical protein n=1 Tax=Geodermatophilus sp. LHW52908 TaxID=2303986 RepID=UPI0011C0F9BD|nr:hypothetical protein [Geodermatophilus sp. LHW52908]